jgi:hypothetical protein
MKNTLRIAAVCGVATLLIAGCKKTDDNNINFSNAINTYYASHPACLWDDPVKFPVQVTTSDTAKTSGYDALVDQGLLQRTTAEKKVFIIASKQVTNYDLSDKGRGAWTADPTQPGFGNFCYGHRTVSSIDSTTPTGDQPGATTQVAYHASFTGMPSWASTPETQNAFPQLHTDLSGPQAAAATLLNTSSGWQMQAPASAHKAITGADGKIVE